jgi:hypothetical protein
MEHYSVPSPALGPVQGCISGTEQSVKVGAVSGLGGHHPEPGRERYPVGSRRDRNCGQSGAVRENRC